MRLLDRIAQDPVFYAVRLLVFGSLLFLVVVAVYAQTEFQVTCENGWCKMKEADMDKLQTIIEMMANKIMELKATTGCS